MLYPCPKPKPHKKHRYWHETWDGDGFARLLADRHYSRKSPGARYFCGPGEKLVLVDANYTALFVWRMARYRRDGQESVECAIFRNESPVLSSELIIEAMEIARQKWPGQRFFTYVAPEKIRSTNPGYCFLKAGWQKCGRSKVHNLTILEYMS